MSKGFPGGARGKEPSCQCRRCKRYRFDPWVGRSPEEGMASLLQCCYMENLMGKESGRLQSTWLQTVEHDGSDLATCSVSSCD